MPNKFYDISQSLDKCNVFEDDLIPVIERIKSIENFGYNLTNIHICAHNGTHIDAPNHYFKNGKGINELSLDVFYGECEVKDWQEQIPICTRLLIKNKQIIDENEAILIVKSNIKLIGITSQSIGNDEVHKILLKAEIVILEGIVLDNIPIGKYTLCAFPLRIGPNIDGSPVRAILISN
jgi:arylformamidase